MNDGKSMDDLYKNLKKVIPCEKIHFKCVSCGACCRHVKQQVSVEAIDAYRIARYLRNHGEDIRYMDDFLEKYAEPVLLDECGYFIYFLKTRGNDDACIFLENNRCKIHVVNPRACKTYPFVIEPDDKGNFTYWLSKEREHHFDGPIVHPKLWIKKRFTSGDRTFLTMDFGRAKEIATLLRKIPEDRLVSALLNFQFAKYGGIDLDKPFIPQYEKNMQQLIKNLSRMSSDSLS